MARIAFFRGFFCISFLGVCTLALDSHGFVPMRGDSGIPIKWRRASDTSALHVDLVLIPANASGLDAQAVYTSVVRGLQRWNEASLGQLQFDLWTGSDRAVYSPGVAYDGYSKIYFSSQVGSATTGSVLAVTHTISDTNTGQILEADVELNDLNFTFTLNPQDSVGLGNGKTPTVGANGRMKVFIENVVTHELGHVFGLAHDGGQQSTMMPFESPSQARLSCDDRTGIQALYPTSGFSNGKGVLGGMVVSESGRAMVGAFVSAVSQRRGVIVGSTLTDATGQFAIDGLEAGSYAVLVAPFGGGSGYAPNYYHGMNSNICGGRAFSRSFLTETGTLDGRLKLTTVVAGRSQNAGTLVARCQTPEQGQGTGGVVALRPGEGAVMGGEHRGLEIQHTGGVLEIKLLAYSLYYSRAPLLDLVDSAGQVVSMEIAQPSFTAESGYRNWDLHARAVLPAGNYRLQTSTNTLAAPWMLGSPSSIDASSAVVVLVQSAAAAPALQRELPWNARCEAADSAAGYVSPVGVPPKGSGAYGAGACGTLQDLRERPSDDQLRRVAAGWFLSWGWILFLPGLRALRIRRNAVSLKRGSILT